ncbi:MAG TPA: hypothetical protein VFN74_01820 [Chloroflexota bacterium]|nr:hypothetical protein [Chloroflexota bacterium]
MRTVALLHFDIRACSARRVSPPRRIVEEELLVRAGDEVEAGKRRRHDLGRPGRDVDGDLAPTVEPERLGNAFPREQWHFFFLRSDAATAALVGRPARREGGSMIQVGRFHDLGLAVELAVGPQ